MNARPRKREAWRHGNGLDVSATSTIYARYDEAAPQGVGSSASLDPFAGLVVREPHGVMTHQRLVASVDCPRGKTLGTDKGVEELLQR